MAQWQNPTDINSTVAESGFLPVSYILHENGREHGTDFSLHKPPHVNSRKQGVSHCKSPLHHTHTHTFPVGYSHEHAHIGGWEQRPEVCCSCHIQLQPSHMVTSHFHAGLQIQELVSAKVHHTLRHCCQCNVEREYGLVIDSHTFGNETADSGDVASLPK